MAYGLFTLISRGLFTVLASDTDSDLDCKPNGYIVLCKAFHSAQNRIQIPILTDNYRNGIAIGIIIRIRIQIRECE